MRSYNARVTGSNMNGSAPGLPAASAAAPQDEGSLSTLIHQRLLQAQGWLPFDEFMHLALYAPGLGYYARDSRPFGLMARDGSDFVTAPELSPLFGAALARQLAQALQAAQADTLWEFGAGSGALAAQVLTALDALGCPPQRYVIVEVSGALRAQQAQRLAAFGPRVQWASSLPEQMHGVLLGNEVLDAMPVKLLHWDGRQWYERGVAAAPEGDGWAWADRPTTLRPPVSDEAFVPGAVTELHQQAQGFVRMLAQRLVRGAAFFIDYGFPEAEYYHPQRSGGTLMCHRGHRADSNPLADVGEKDITSHLDFSALALAGQDAGLEVAGYTSQAHFLLNCGITDLLQTATLAERAAAQKLLTEHEMGELFKVIAYTRGLPDGWRPLGFARGDRSHRL
jgi:SAM-dependent MidA family methyltransferase